MNPPPAKSSDQRASVILDHIEALPTLSAVATRLLSVASDDEADIREIITLIESDPALTTKIIALCRRASTGLGSKITTVDRAVVMLGIHAVRNATLSVEIFQRFAPTNAVGENTVESLGFDAIGFWQHSIAVAVASQQLTQKSKTCTVAPDEAFVAGLLHDLGKFTLAHLIPKAYDRVIELARQRLLDVTQIEREIIGVDHHTVGKRLARHWNLPDALHDVLWLHGQELDAIPVMAHKPLIAVVTLANHFVHQWHIGQSGEHAPPRDLTDLLAYLTINREDLDAISASIHQEVARRSHDLGLTQKPTTHLLIDSISRANLALGRTNHRLIQKSEAAQRAFAILQTIARFTEDVRSARTVTDVCGRVVASAAHFLGKGVYALMHTGDDPSQWHLSQFAADGRLISSIDIVPGDLGIDPSIPLVDTQVSPAMLRLLPLLATLTHNRASLQSVRLLPLSDGHSTQAVLIHDRAQTPLEPSSVACKTLLATWTAAINAAQHHCQSERLNEDLAIANRRLSTMRDQLAQSQAMASLGELAAGAAHEMNNPLCVISGRAQVLAKSITHPGQREMANQIVKQSQHLSNLITSLHVFARPPRAQPTTVAIDKLLAQAITQAHATTDTTHEVNVNLKTTIPTLWWDEGHLLQCIVDLLCNAIESQPASPIRISVDIDAHDDRLMLAITDDGCGMDDETRRHAFDPFFSRKTAGRQAGLGLARARQLLLASNGSIDLQSTVGKGTTARIMLNNWRKVTENNGQPVRRIGPNSTAA